MRSKSQPHRSLAWAACAMAVAATLTPAATWAHTDAVGQIQRYCTASWQRAGIAYQDWEDCTQDTIAELLTRIGVGTLPLAIVDPLSPQRRELRRCVWCTIKRWQRAMRWDCLIAEDVADDDAQSAQFPCSWDDLLEVACRVVSPRQQAILALCGHGWDIPDIAAALRISPVQVSRAKHKALRKLRHVLAPDQQLG